MTVPMKPRRKRRVRRWKPPDVPQKRARWAAIQWAVLGALWVAVLVLGHLGYRQRYHELGKAYGFGDIVYLDLHLFGFSTSGDVGAPPLPVTLEIARFLAPLVGAFSALKAFALLFRDRFDQVRMLFVRGHVVVVGAGETGRVVATALVGAGERVVMIDRLAAPEGATALRGAGVLVAHGDARERGVLQQAGVERARAVIVLCGDDATNADVAARVSEIARDGDRVLTCITHIVDPELCRLLRVEEFQQQGDAGGHPFELDFLNIEDAAGRALASTHVASAGGDVVLIAGTSPLATALEAALRRNAEQAGAVLPWFIAAEDPAGCVTHAYVCEDDDGSALEAALTLDGRLDPSVPVTVAFRRRGGLAALAASVQHAASGRLHPFVVLDAFATEDVLRPWTIEAIARTAHDSYRRQRLLVRDRPTDDPSLQPWEQLPDALRDSNRAQARGVVDKLRRIGAVVVPDDGSASGFALTAEEIEALSELEHERWCAERRAAGWKPGGRDAGAKRTPYLVPWAELAEDIREYDREAVRNIPTLLAAAGFRAVRVRGGAGASARPSSSRAA